MLSVRARKTGENMRLLQLTTAMAIASLLAGCATVRQQDLDAWGGVPVEALDTHSL